MSKISIEEVVSYRPVGQNIHKNALSDSTTIEVTTLEQNGVKLPGTLITVRDLARNRVVSRHFYAIDGSTFFLKAEMPKKPAKKSSKAINDG